MALTVPLADLHRVVTTCVIYRDRTYLIKKRAAEEPFPERWEVAGGGLERADYIDLPSPNPDGWEDVLDSVVRKEVLQETGLVVGELRYLGNSVFIRKHDNIPVIVLRFAAPYISGEVVLDGEATEYAWPRAEGIRAFGLIGSIADDIEKLDRILAQ